MTSKFMILVRVVYSLFSLFILECNVLIPALYRISSLSVTLFYQTDQKLRLCDICGAFLSIYDKLSFVTFKKKLRVIAPWRLASK